MVVAVVLMAAMVVIGLATLAFIDNQQGQSGHERVSESSFDLANGVVKAELFILSRNWPGSAAKALPASCSSSTGVSKCPDPATLANQFSGSDFAGATWTTTVQDNGPPVTNYYRTNLAVGQPSYDASGPGGVPDGKVWVRAQSLAHGQRRTIVTLVTANQVQIPFPGNLVTAGYFATTNNGKKVILDTNGSSYTSTPGNPGAVAVRCTSAAPSPNSCLSYQPSKGQISPATDIQTGYPNQTAVSSEQLDEMRSIARSQGTYYATGCPSSLTGAMVFIETGSCTYTGGGYNSLSSPGVVVMGSGKLTLNGNAIYYGLIYSANLQQSTDYMVSLNGTARVIGAVAVDYGGGVMAGSSTLNIAFNGNVFGNVKGYLNANPVKGNWRELVG